MLLPRPLYILHRSLRPPAVLSTLSTYPRVPLRHFQTTPHHLQDTSSGNSSQDLPPALLARARSLNSEYKTLETSLNNAGTFSTSTARRMGSLRAISSALNSYEEALSNLAELNSMLSDPSLDSEILSLARSDIAATESQLGTLAQKLRHSLVPKHRFAHLPALVEIRPGTGGSEAAIFALDLWKMYQSYASQRSWRTQTVSFSPNEPGDGLIEGIFEVAEDGAYDELRLEAGVHRVQRIPATEKQGRTHTSTANVMVLPSFPTTEVGEGEEDPDAAVDMKDVRIDIMRARGAGGQHVNTTDSAVRMTHLPTGIVAAIQDSRSQHKNREKCLAVLKSRIAEKRRAEREAEEQKMRRGVAKVGAGRSDKIRTYNYSQNRVTDHRPGYSAHDLPAVMTGEDLGKLVEVVREWGVEREVEALAEEEEMGKK